MLKSGNFLIGTVENNMLNTHGFTRYFAQIESDMRMGAENGDIVLGRIKTQAAAKVDLPRSTLNIYKDIIDVNINTVAYSVEIERILYDANSYKFMVCRRIGKQYKFVCDTTVYLPKDTNAKYIAGGYYVCITSKCLDKVAVGSFMGLENSTELAVNNILFRNRIFIEDFSPDIVNTLKSWTAKKDKSYNTRVHLQDKCIFTVDPSDCKDMDDALSIERVGQYYMVDVHIADVSHFVKQNTYFDEVAKNRCNTLYLPNGIITMLPNLLCEDYCSLNPNEERFAITCRMFYDRYGCLKYSTFFRSVIKSCRKMSYEEAQAVIDGERLQGKRNIEIMSSIVDLNHLASMLREERMEKGALLIGAPEIKLIMNKSKMIGFDIKTPNNANHFIEEFMIAANVEVGKRLLKYFPTTAIMRIHSGLNRFADYVKRTAENMNIIVKYDGKMSITALGMTISEVLKNTLHKAIYVPGDISGHEGLKVDAYTHFTSPIRRYADIVAHRQLLMSMGIYTDCVPLVNIYDICQNMNNRSEISKSCYRLCNDIYLREYLSRSLQYIVIVSGYVTRITATTLTVYIPCICTSLPIDINLISGAVFKDNLLEVIIDRIRYEYKFLNKITIEICRDNTFRIRSPKTNITGILNRLN